MERFVGLVKNIWEQKTKVDRLKDELSAETSKLEGLKKDAMKLMETLELDKQHVPGCGTIYRQVAWSVRVPKTPQDKAALFDWIATHKGQDVLDNLITINSQSLNSFYKAELEEAKAVGNVDFRLPGIETPDVYYTLAMRKG